MTENNDEDEAIIAFGDDDDDMADLFSFAAANSPQKKQEVVDYSEALASVMPLPRVENHDSDSEDSFIEMLEQHKETTVVDPSIVNGDKKKKDMNVDEKKDQMGEANMKEILDWLDTEDDGSGQAEEELLFIEPPKPASLESTVLKRPTSDTPPPNFETLEQAVKSPKSTIEQIRSLLEKQDFVVASSLRRHLWCKVVCGKTLEETLQCSVADSFQHWEQQWNHKEADLTEWEKAQLEWIQEESGVLANRIVTNLKGDPDLCQRALTSILTNYYNIGKKSSTDEESTSSGGAKDLLLPPVACAILSAGIPKVATAVILSDIVPHYMPILGLTTKEREVAARTLHQQFYLLACYHLPLLALHLDRYLPDWYVGRPKGLIPQTYLVSHLAGECGGAFMNARWLLCLWDIILASNNSSLRYFLVLAVLEKSADELLLLTETPLREKLDRILLFEDDVTDDGFAIEAEEETTSSQANRWVREWTEKAQTLWEGTPLSVLRLLKQSEDEAVKDALRQRQEEAEERLKQKLEAQAKAHQEALEAEKERKADEARTRLTRARLVAFYRQHNPGKENNIEKIMKTYEGRFEVLDAKLKQKYGVGFNPALKPKSKANNNAGKLLSTMNQELGRRTQMFGSKGKEESTEPIENDVAVQRNVVLKVTASEVLPVVCWSKEVNRGMLANSRRGSMVTQTEEGRIPLKYYLVDSRPEEAVASQGKFPTSLCMSPEILLDHERLKQQEDMLEALRGSVHICIMGEGYSALPELYGHKMTAKLSEYIAEDECRNSNCALFFLKKGFPFVSILDGGFAAAHAYLCREGPKVHLQVNHVLTDYKPDISIFGQFETLHNASGREKAQRALQNLFDTSMTALTKNTMRFESLASEIGGGNAAEESHQKSGQNVVTRFFAGHDNNQKKGSDTKRDDDGSKSNNNNASQPGPFLNPFGFIQSPSKHTRDRSDESLVVESVDFEKGGDDQTKNLKEANIGSPTSVPRQPTNTFSLFKHEPPPLQPSLEAKTSDKVESKTGKEQGKSNPFAGIGAAFNNSLKNANSKDSNNSSNNNNNNEQANGSKSMNPFARFGMNNIGNSQNVNVATPFAGLNQLRKNTMARMMQGGSDGNNNNNNNNNYNKVGGDDDDDNNSTVNEESVSFDQSSPAIAPSSNDNDDDAGEEKLSNADDNLESMADSEPITPTTTATTTTPAAAVTSTTTSEGTT